jgi:hypothetical protein
LAELARDAARPLVALAALHTRDAAARALNAERVVTLRGRLAEAGVRCSMGESAAGIALARSVVQQFDARAPRDADEATLLADALCAEGQWLGDAQSSAGGTMQLRQSCELYRQYAPTRLAAAYAALADYADRLGEALNEQLESSEWRASTALRRAKERDIVRFTARLNAVPRPPAKEVSARARVCVCVM